MHRVLYLIQKEFRQVLRDRAMLFIIFFAPIIQMTLLGFAITVDVKDVKLVVVDFDRSFASRDIVRRFQNNPYFDLIGYCETPEEVAGVLDVWQAQMALVLPIDFGRDLLRGARPDIQIVVDGLDGNTAGIALGYAQELIAQHAAGLSGNRNLEPGLSRTGMVEPLIRMWYNLDLESKNYMVPGLIAVLLTMVSMFLSSMGLVREKELGTLEQLMVTPIRTWELILGKVLPFLLLGFLGLSIMLTVAFIIFQLTLHGSIVFLFLMSGVYLLSTLGLGIFISTIAQTQQQAMFISWFFMIFMIFMSGFLFPIENMPSVVQYLTYLDPMRYFVVIIREIFLKGSSVGLLRYEILSMAAFGILIISLSAITFRKRVE